MKYKYSQVEFQINPDLYKYSEVCDPDFYEDFKASRANWLNSKKNKFCVSNHCYHDLTSEVSRKVKASDNAISILKDWFEITLSSSSSLQISLATARAKYSAFERLIQVLDFRAADDLYIPVFVSLFERRKVFFPSEPGRDELYKFLSELVFLTGLILNSYLLKNFDLKYLNCLVKIIDFLIAYDVDVSFPEMAWLIESENEFSRRFSFVGKGM